MGGDRKRKIKILLVSGFPTNKNSASYNRNLSIQKMVSNSFEYETIQAPDIKIKSKWVIFSAVRRYILSLFTLWQIIKKTKEKGYIYFVFLRSTNPFTAFIVWIISKPRRIKIAIERNEFPAAIRNQDNSVFKGLFYKIFVLTWHYRLFDIIFLMTDELYHFYRPHANRKAIIRKLPMTVDFVRFEKIKEKDFCQYIFYAGSLEEKKDGVESLIYAFNEIAADYPFLQLKIAGGTKHELKEVKIKHLIEQLSLNGRVEMLGIVDRTEIPELIASSKILVLPRPDSIQARGGFPTKLGEYLASGKPVIVTRIGEIPEYLSEKEVFFISPYNIVHELAERIKEIVNDYDKAKQKAVCSKEIARTLFGLEANQVIIKKAFEEASSLDHLLEMD
jgi:glycosyltransferase involved in cell wall biosynthesis